MLDRSLRLLFLFTMLTNTLLGQQDYFQQEVNYTIKASLDDAENLLDASMQIEYVNNSPDELTTIMFHLWPNAYSDRNTAFAKQKINSNSDEFFFAKEEDLGGFRSIDFSTKTSSRSLLSPTGNANRSPVFISPTGAVIRFTALSTLTSPFSSCLSRLLYCRFD